jgi:hypothetical protein
LDDPCQRYLLEGIEKSVDEAKAIDYQMGVLNFLKQMKEEVAKQHDYSSGLYPPHQSQLDPVGGIASQIQEQHS